MSDATLATETPQPHARSGSRRALRWALIASAALAGLWLLAWAVVPPLVKAQAEQRLGELLGREVTIGRVAFAPWALALTIESLQIGPSAGADRREPQLTIERIFVNADLRSLLRLAPVVEAVEVDGPRLRLTRLSDGHYDVDDLLSRFQRQTPAASDDAPAHFALYNLRLTQGSFEFDDRPVGRLHRLQDLQLSLPFLSNLPADLAITVEPRLAFKLNGASFDSGAQAKPFAQDRSAQLRLHFADFDLAPYLPYLPAALPLRPSRGVFASDLELQFAQPPGAAPQVSLRGRASLRDVAIAGAGAASTPLASWKLLQVGLTDVQPLVRRIALGAVSLDGAQVDVRRAADGSLNLLASAFGAKPEQAAAPDSKEGWRISMEQFALSGARIDWHDATVQPAAALRVDALDLSLAKPHWPTEVAMPLKLAGRLSAIPASAAPASATAASISVNGEVSDRAANARLELQALELRWLAPYLAQALTATIEGQASVAATLDWARGEQPRLALGQIDAKLRNLRLFEAAAATAPARGPGSTPPRVALPSAEITESSLDLLAQRVVLGKVKVERPVVHVHRNLDGQWNVLTWARPREDDPQGKAAVHGWQTQLGEAQLSGGEVHLLDERPPGAASAGSARVRALASGIQVNVRGLALPGAALARTHIQLNLAADNGGPAPLARPSAKPGSATGRIEWTGQLATSPLQLRGNLHAERVPIHAFEALVQTDVNLALVRAEASWRGSVAMSQADNGLSLGLRGDALLGDVQVNERLSSDALRTATHGDELLSWQALALRDLQLDMKPGSKPRLDIREAALTDFYSRLVITEQGRFNLRDAAGAPGTAASTPASPPAAAAASGAHGPGLPIDVAVGGVQLVNGKVDFTDRFIKPNFSAALSALNGRLGAFNSTTRDMASLDLRGRVAGTAQLEIVGSVNPTAQPLAMDLRAKATDLELAPLSPYSGRYAGYAIERGKLSVDLAYKIDPDGKLDAKNQVVLNQLTFGDKVESPDATKLPVLLAVSLLKDRHGVIDINLPVSGSLNDPQFSVFGIVIKIIGNLLAKAFTAPFALLAGGDSEDLSWVGFEPGTALPTGSGKAALDKVAKALLDRPELKMTVTGGADPVSEREAMQKAALAQRLQVEQRRDALRSGGAADTAPPALTPAQREELIRRIYGATSVPNKPRNVLGFAKDIPVAEMEILLLGAIPVTTDTARELALQRGLAVRDSLVAKDLPSERLFLAAPKLRASGEDDAAWSPRVQLSLGTK